MSRTIKPDADGYAFRRYYAQRPTARELAETARSQPLPIGRPKKKRPLYRNRFDRLFCNQGGRCALCGCPLGAKAPGAVWDYESGTSIDHIKPLAFGGGNEITNLQLTHVLCNNRKGSQWGGLNGALVNQRKESRGG